MLLLPIGRDDAIVQRHAWISYALIALNVLMFVATLATSIGTSDLALQQKAAAFQEYAEQHPYLAIPQEVRPFVSSSALKRLREAAPPGTSGAIVQAEQQELERRSGEFIHEYHRQPTIRFGYIPADPSFARLILSMFVHSGLMHLVGNMLFFFVTGPFIEDAFGRPLFAFLYFSGGIVATMTFAVRHSDSVIPLVGASGAIAAVMGAYLVRFARSRLEFIFVPFLFRPQSYVRFFVPAFVVLPLWFVEQYWLMTEEAHGGTAFSAHVGGFVYGAAVAGIVYVTQFEQKFVQPVVEKQTTWTADVRMIRATDARLQHDFDTAWREVRSLLAADPKHIDALRAAVDIALDAQDNAQLDVYATRLLDRYQEEKQHDLALGLVHELSDDPAAAPLPRFYIRGAAVAERSGQRDVAVALYEAVCSHEPQQASTVGHLVRLSSLYRQSGDDAAARTMLQRARSHPACNGEWMATIDAKLAALRSE